MAIGLASRGSNGPWADMDTIVFESEAYLMATVSFVWVEVAHLPFQPMGYGVVFTRWRYYLRVVDKLAKERMKQRQWYTRFPRRRAATIKEEIIILELLEFLR